MNQIRKKKVDEILNSNGISAIIFWRPEELVMMLGYYPLWGLSFLVYSDDEQPVLFVPQAEPEDILPEGIEIRRFPWGELTNIDPWEILFNEIKQLLKEKQIFEKQITFLSDLSAVSPCRMSGEGPHLPTGLTHQLMQINEGRVKNIDGDLLKLFQYKTEVDIAGIKLAHQVIAKAVAVFYEHAQPGITEARLASLIESEVSLAMEDSTIFIAKAWPLIQSGINATEGGRFNRTTAKIINDGELVMLEMSACVNGYWLDITRTAQVGVMNELQKEIYNTVKEAQQLAIQAIQPGKEMKSIDAIARNYIAAAGYADFFNHALGHHVGFRYHDPGHVLSPFSNGIIEEGMVLTVEPGIYGAALKAGVRIEDNILVTANGYEILSAY
jgi:Xaa-Pro dipeptidase